MSTNCDQICTSSKPGWVAPPKPTVTSVHEGDFVWTVDCSLDQLTSFFLDTRAWMNCISCQSGQDLELKEHFVVAMDPIHRHGMKSLSPLFKQQFSPALATPEGSKGLDLLLNALYNPASTLGDSRVELNGGLFGFTFLERFDLLRQRLFGERFEADLAFVREFLMDLPQAQQFPKVTVQGIHGTGIITVRPTNATDLMARITRTNWDQYWKDWEDDTKSTLEITLADNLQNCYGHLEIVPKPNGNSDEDRADKIAAFIILGSRSVDHLNKILKKKPKSGKTKFKAAGPSALETVHLLYQDKMDSDERACEVICGSVQEGDEAAILSAR